jgi:hypothetical protein
LKSLLGGSRSTGQEEAGTGTRWQEWAASLEKIPTWFLWGADIALLALAATLAGRQDHPPALREMVTAGFMVTVGGLLAVFALIRPEPDASLDASVPEWLVSRLGTGDTEKTVIFRGRQPAFAGEVQWLPGGRWVVIPVPVEGCEPMVPADSQRFAVEAAKAFQIILDQRAKTFRASLA